ncbi:hypothetical protein KAJ89_01215 [Candidatus Parcubacteria bacterium]|nr:hypothetical protein [Candidatus Parcubacteria bacterium]
MKHLKKYYGEVITIIGVAITSYNIFNFSYMDNSLVRTRFNNSDNIAYFYSDTVLLCISIGFSLIIIGVLVIKNKK